MSDSVTATGPAVEVRDLVVRRGGREVLHGIDFAVPTGSVTGIVGPSGGGKSTAMRCVVGVQVVASGTVRVLGLPAGSAALRRRVGYVTQAPSVYADLTVRDNVRYFAALRGENAGSVDGVLRDVDMAGYANALVGNLSGGQHARVSLACALLGPPELLVLDEPTVGLDPVLRRDLWQLFHDLARRGTTLMVSSHVMDEAGHCDRLLLLRDGRLVAAEAPREILRRTGADDLEQAFLALVEETGAAGAAVATGAPAAVPGATPVAAGPTTAQEGTR